MTKASEVIKESRMEEKAAEPLQKSKAETGKMGGLSSPTGSINQSDLGNQENQENREHQKTKSKQGDRGKRRAELGNAEDAKIGADTDSGGNGDVADVDADADADADADGGVMPPPFCPNPECPAHREDYSELHPGKRWYLRRGMRPTGINPENWRYQCSLCGRWFCSNTFKLTYHAHRDVDVGEIFEELGKKNSLRGICGIFSCSYRLLRHRIGVLARQITAVTTKILELIRLQEDLAADGFQTFCTSQDFPVDYNLLVGEDSEFVYAATYSPLKRKGRMTDKQRQRAFLRMKQFPGVVPKGAMRKGFDRMCEILSALHQRMTLKRLTLFTDKHPVYPSCVRRMMMKHLKRFTEKPLSHRRISGKDFRGTKNPLFPVNYLDRQITKDMPEHFAETMCFGRNVNDQNNRLKIYLYRHNFLNPHRVKERTFRSHADLAGISGDCVIDLRGEMLKRRFFLSHVDLAEHDRLVWTRSYRSALKGDDHSIPAYLLE